MSADRCFWCASFDVVTVDPDGDGCCANCRPLLDSDSCCGYCGEGTPVKMVGLWPACPGCANLAHQRDRIAAQLGGGPTREMMERIARDAGVTGDIWSLTLQDFVTRVLEARCMKLGLIKARNVDVTMQVVANEVGR